MSDPDEASEKFLQRWSRRKQAAETRVPDEVEPVPQQRTDVDANAPERAAEKIDAEFPKFDLKSLPPIESISAASDIRAFLAPGVPEELTRAALRRAWVTDPTIRDFIGLAENQWDFTNPDSIPGFGTLEFTDDIRRMVAELIGDRPQEKSTPAPREGADLSAQSDDKPDQTAPAENGAGPARKNPDAGRLPAREAPVPVGDISAEAPQVDPQTGASDAAVQNNIDDAGRRRQAAHRKHGGAVPK